MSKGLLTGGDSDAAWSRFGESDPYYGVLSDDRYRAEALTEATRAEFFATGERDVDAIFRTLREHLVPDFRPHRALDFGCGVGRMLIPLAARCDRVLGVDVASGMLEEARQQCSARGIQNVEFAQTDDALAAVTGKFDFIHSYIVFQHIPSPRQARILRRLIDLLEDGGVGAIHCLYQGTTGGLPLAHWARKHVPFVNGLVNVLVRHRPFDMPFMQMNPMSLQTAFELLQRNGCQEVHVGFSNHGSAGRDNLGMTLFFRRVTRSSL